MRLTLAFATSSGDPNLTDDDRLAVAALAPLGVRVEPWIWDSPAGLPPFDGVVLRSCWDYHEKTEAFLDWLGALERSGARVFNPPRIAAWNLDKRYLADLAARGVTVPSTLWVEAGSTSGLGELLRASGMREAVVKPVVGMLGIDTWRTSLETAAEHEAAFAALVHERAVMVQEFLPNILTEGEVSLVFLGGRFSHAVRKRPRAGEFRIQSEHGGTRHPLDPTASWLRCAQSVVSAVDAPLLYARVDGVPDGDELVLMELELIDPFLFLGHEPRAPARFAAAILDAFRS